MNQESFINQSSNKNNSKIIIITIIISITILLSIGLFFFIKNLNNQKDNNEQSIIEPKKEYEYKEISLSYDYPFLTQEGRLTVKVYATLKYCYENQNDADKLKEELTGTIDETFIPRIIPSEKIDNDSLATLAFISLIGEKINDIQKIEIADKKQATEKIKDELSHIEKIEYTYTPQKNNSSVKVLFSEITLLPKIKDEDPENDNKLTSNYLKNIDLKTLEEKISNKDTFILVVTQKDCMHCKEYKPNLIEVLEEYKITAYEFDQQTLAHEQDGKLVYDQEQLARFKKIANISGTPTTLFISNGAETTVSTRIIGNRPKKNIVERFTKMGYITENKNNEL